MKRSELKSIVKECLVELLSEGLDKKGTLLKSEAKKRHKNKTIMQAEEKRLKEHREKFETNISSLVSNITDDPIMQDILSETARTTLQEQIPQDNTIPTNFQNTVNTAPSAAGIDLDSIFNDPQQNWATLAFAENKTN